jgi:general secretion pathway protein D
VHASPAGHRACGRAACIAFLCALTAALTAGCSSSLSPSLIDEMRSADIGEKHPQKVTQGSTDSGPASRPALRQFETYPGDDRYRDPAITASKRKGKLAQAGLHRVSDGYQLSFDNASLSEVTKVILGDTLKLPYYYDPRVQGQVTLATGRSVSREDLLSVLETALKMNNAVLLNSDGSYRIAPAADALTGEVGGIGREGAQTPGFGVSVLPLRHVSAEAVMTLVENFISKGGTLKAEGTGNLLLIRGTARERQSLMEVAASFDVDWLKGQSAGIFPLTHSTPDELIGELSQAMGTEEGNLLTRMVRFQPLQRLNAVLVLARQSSHLKQAAEWIKRLDRFNEAGQDLHVYRVENGRAQDLAALLNDTLGTGATTRRGRRSELAPGRSASKLASRATQPTGLGNSPLSAQLPTRKTTEQPSPSPSPAFAPNQAQGAATPPPIRITPDDANNLLLIYANTSDFRRISNVLREIDRPPLQVMINATIVEVTLNDSLRYGVQVFLKGKNVAGGFVGPADIPLVPNTFGLNLIVGSLSDPKVVLDALADVTEVKVVSSPAVVVVDNQPAILKVGDEVPVSTQQSTLLDTPDARVVNSIQFRDTGVILKVIPRVNSTGLVTMDIEQEISSVVKQGEGPTLTPTISQRQVASTISVYSGQMVALGGLISEQRHNDKSGLPLLSKIPVLGDIVGLHDRGMRRTELIVFIRPQVIRTSRDARDVTEELRARLKSLAPPPPGQPEPR